VPSGGEQEHMKRSAGIRHFGSGYSNFGFGAPNNCLYAFALR